jgi:2C-methyl-D-erythritol 2,4-cyclodiphosphate synthase
LDGIDITSTSRSSATTSDFVIRETPSVRLIFRPELVDNSKDPAACVRGTFVYQRKGKSADWSDSKFTSLSSLKKGEGYQIELKSGELLPLLRHLSMLYRYQRGSGIPHGRQRLVRMEENLANLLELGEEDLNDFLDAHTTAAVGTLRRVLRWLASSSALGDFITSDGGDIAVMNAVLGVAALRTIRGIWEGNRTNPSEEFWQRALSSHAFVFSQLFAYPIVIIGDRVYVGGKRLDNRHGSIADFMARSELTGNAVLIEIKAPTTMLLGAEYRDEVYPLSAEVGGAVAQVMKYRDSLMESMRALSQPDAEPILSTEPRCIVLAGDTRQLNDRARRQSFERFRERVNGVMLVTFDELFQRVSQLEQLLTPPSAG